MHELAAYALTRVSATQATSVAAILHLQLPYIYNNKFNDQQCTHILVVYVVLEFVQVIYDGPIPRSGLKV